jgi:serine protease Do
MLAALCSGWAVFIPLRGFSEVSGAPTQTPATDFAPVVEKVAPCVVTILTSHRAEPGDGHPLLEDPILRRYFGRHGHSPRLRGLGSGVVVSSDGFILTSNHVIEGADEILVGLGPEKQEHKARKIGADPGTDLAILKIEAQNLSPIPFADSDQLRPGNIVLAIGSPFGLAQTVTMGIVSATERGGLGIIDHENFIQTDASINMGNSGGALVNTSGELVGINSAILSRTGSNHGIGFAIPSNLARDVMPSLREKGRVVRGYIGAFLQVLTPELVEALKLPDPSGALVGEVAPGSPAQISGVRSGDVITRINDDKVANPIDLRAKIGAMSPGTKAEIEVLRDHERRVLEVIVAEAPATPAKPVPDQAVSDRRQVSKVLGGVIITDVDDEVRMALNAPREVLGAVIVAIDPTSPAAEAGLQQGDVIREINKRPIKDARDLVTQSEAMAPDDKVLLHVWSEGKSGYIALLQH